MCTCNNHLHWDFIPKKKTLMLRYIKFKNSKFPSDLTEAIIC